MINPRPYQTAAIQALAGCDLGHIVAPAGSGKTIMVALAIKLAGVRKLRPLSVLWVAYTKEQVEQGREACEAVGLDTSRIQFACIQGLDEVGDVDLVFIDECHHIASPEGRAFMRTTLDKRDGRWIRKCMVWGCTATPDREDGQDITPIIGRCVHRVTQADVSAVGGTLPGRYKVVRYDDPQAGRTALQEANAKTQYWMSDEQASRVLWQAVLKHCVTRNSARNAFVAELAEQYKHTSRIVLLDTVQQCKDVANGIQGAVAFYSGMGSKQREESMQRFRAGDLGCICATSIADEGMNAPIAQVLIMARVGKAKGRTEQRVGRVLRPYPGQDHGLVVDVCDSAHKMLEIQHFQRLNLYRKWGFEALQAMGLSGRVTI